MSEPAKKTIVRGPSRMVFEINPNTLEPKGCSTYDAHCYSDPETGVEYIERDEWSQRRNEQRDQAMRERYA